MITPKSVPPKPSRKRATVALGRELEQCLRSYAAAAKAVTTNLDTITLAASVASAAGVVMLGSISSEAEVVYTPTHIVMQGRFDYVSSLNLDLDNDGQADFKLTLAEFGDFSSGRFAVYGWIDLNGQPLSNRVVESSKQQWDAALPLGAQIGPKGPFGNAQRMNYCAQFTSNGFSSGPWRGVTDRYLGFKFQIDGKSHYGWARVSVTQGCFYTLTLTGYAYDTIPDHPIRTVLPVANPAVSDRFPSPEYPRPASLGALALGAPGLQMWRPTRDAVPGQ